jgi:hypothetical protein
MKIQYILVGFLSMVVSWLLGWNLGFDQGSELREQTQKIKIELKYIKGYGNEKCQKEEVQEDKESLYVEGTSFQLYLPQMCKEDGWTLARRPLRNYPYSPMPVLQ